MSETLAERLIRGAVWAVSVADHHADTLTPRQINELYAAGDAAREAETALKEADHPTAEDYRNRAERAEQECAELRETVARLREALPVIEAIAATVARLREALPVIEAIAAWERENGTVAAIMPEEYPGFMDRLKAAAIRGSCRTALENPDD